MLSLEVTGPENGSRSTYNNDSWNDINSSIMSGTLNDSNNIPARIALGILLVILTCIAIFGNILVLLAISRTRFLRRLNNYLIISLADIDLFASFLIMPLSAVDLFNNSAWIFPKGMCPPYAGLAISYSVVSVLNVTAISLERVFMITQPMSYQRIVTPVRMVLVIVMIWILGFTYGMLQMLWFAKEGFVNFFATEKIQICLFNPSFEFAIIHVSVLFFLPLVVMIGSYLKIFSIVQHQMKRIQPSMTDKYDETISEISAHRSFRLDDLNSIEVRPNSILESVSGSRRGIIFNTDTSVLAPTLNNIKHFTMTRANCAASDSHTIITDNFNADPIDHDMIYSNRSISSKHIPQKFPSQYWRRIKTLFKFLDINHHPPDESQVNDINICESDINVSGQDLEQEMDVVNKDDDSGLGVDLKGATTTESSDGPSSRNDQNEAEPTESNDRAFVKQAWVSSDGTSKEFQHPENLENEEKDSPQVDAQIQNISQKYPSKISVLVTTPDGSPLSERKHLSDKSTSPKRLNPILKKPRRTRSWNKLTGIQGGPDPPRERKRSNSESTEDPTSSNLYSNNDDLNCDWFSTLEIDFEDVSDDSSCACSDDDDDNDDDYNDDKMSTIEATDYQQYLRPKKQNYLTVDRCIANQYTIGRSRRPCMRSKSLPGNSLGIRGGQMNHLQTLSLYERRQSNHEKRIKQQQAEFFSTSQTTADCDLKNPNLNDLNDEDIELSDSPDKAPLSKSDTCLNEEKLSLAQSLDKHPLSFQKKLAPHQPSNRVRRNTSIKRRIDSQVSLKELEQDGSDENEYVPKVTVTQGADSKTQSKVNDGNLTVMPFVERSQYRVVFLETVPEVSTPEIERYNLNLDKNDKHERNDDKEANYKYDKNVGKPGPDMEVRDMPKDFNDDDDCQKKDEDESKSGIVYFIQTDRGKNNQPDRQESGTKNHDTSDTDSVTIWREFTPSNVLYLQTIQSSSDKEFDKRKLVRKKPTSVSFNYAKAKGVAGSPLKRYSTVNNLTGKETPLFIPLNQLKLQSAMKKSTSTDTMASSMSKRGSVVFKIHNEEISIVDGKLKITHVLNKTDNETDNDSEGGDNTSDSSNNMFTIDTSSGSNHGNLNDVIWNAASRKHTNIWAMRHFEAESISGSRQSLNLTRTPSNVSEGVQSIAAGSRLGRRSRPSFRRRLQENKAARMSAYVIGAFALCWLPYEILFLIRASCDSSCTPGIAWSVVSVTMFVQAAINPFIYNFYSSEFRRATKNLFLSRKNRIRPGQWY